MRKGLIFDLDGVITDTAKFHYVAWKQLASELGIEIDEKFNETLKGISRMDSLDRILEHGGKTGVYSVEEKERLAAKKNEAYVASLEALTPDDILPGVLELLDAAKQQSMKTAIASASKNAPYILEKLGIRDRFEHIVDPDTLSKSKPDPEIFLKAAEALQILPNEAIGFEDAQAGIDGIKAAGMFAVGVVFDGPLTGADVLVDVLTHVELSELLER